LDQFKSAHVCNLLSPDFKFMTAYRYSSSKTSCLRPLPSQGCAPRTRRRLLSPDPCCSSLIWNSGWNTMDYC